MSLANSSAAETSISKFIIPTNLLTSLITQISTVLTWFSFLARKSTYTHRTTQSLKLHEAFNLALTILVILVYSSMLNLLSLTWQKTSGSSSLTSPLLQAISPRNSFRCHLKNGRHSYWPYRVLKILQTSRSYSLIFQSAMEGRHQMNHPPLRLQQKPTLSTSLILRQIRLRTCLSSNSSKWRLRSP